MLYEALQKENLASDQDLDLDDITTAGPARCPTAPNQKSKPLEAPPPIGGLSLNQLQERANQVITYEWVCSRTMEKNSFNIWEEYYNESNFTEKKEILTKNLLIQHLAAQYHKEA